MSQGHHAIFLEGLPVHHELAMGDYTYLGRGLGNLCAGLPVTVVLNAPFGPLGPLCGTARHSCPEYTIRATGPWDVVASVVFALFVFVLTFLVVISPFYKVDVHLPRKLPTYEIQSFAS